MTTRFPSACRPWPRWPALACVIVCLSSEARASGIDRAELIGQINTSLDSAARFLIASQSADGAWRSHVYGPLKDGPSLTPQAMASLIPLIEKDRERLASAQRGRTYLVSFMARLQAGSDGLRFPAYTAATISRVVAFDAPGAVGAGLRVPWLAQVRGMQLTQSLGYEPSELSFGGWGYSPIVPHMGRPDDPARALSIANLSATVFCLDALRDAAVPPDDPVWAAALTFVQRCQNFPDDPTAADPKYDDGGFYFMPHDAGWNKAGVAGTDRHGITRLHSYGSATADGLRALLDCGLPLDHPRVIAARKWLTAHFDARNVPGTYEPDREVLRNATYYYYAASLSQAFVREGVRDDGSDGWAQALARELLGRQRPDGSWSNDYTDAKEDDPLVATPSAATALELCRRALAASGPKPVPSRVR